MATICHRAANGPSGSLLVSTMCHHFSGLGAVSNRLDTASISPLGTVGNVVESGAQGALIPSESPTDLGIGGNGFFIVQSPDGGRYYTRDGHFRQDAAGRLVNSAGNILQGWALNSANGEPKGNLTDVAVGPYLTIQPDIDGQSAGSLVRVFVNREGVISGQYSNGAVAELFQSALAGFSNPEALQKMGGNLYAQTRSSGPATTGRPGDSGFGTLVANSLEAANVDLAEEMVAMIIIQRSYQANLKMVEMENEINGDLLDIVS